MVVVAISVVDERPPFLSSSSRVIYTFMNRVLKEVAVERSLDAAPEHSARDVDHQQAERAFFSFNEHGQKNEGHHVAPDVGVS